MCVHVCVCVCVCACVCMCVFARVLELHGNNPAPQPNKFDGSGSNPPIQYNSMVCAVKLIMLMFTAKCLLPYRVCSAIAFRRDPWSRSGRDLSEPPGIASTPLIVANSENNLLILDRKLEICVVLNHFDDVAEVVPAMLATIFRQLVGTVH